MELPARPSSASSPAQPRDAAVDSLPPDVVDSLSGFLLGADLFRLSHASPRLRKLLDTNADVWGRRRGRQYGDHRQRGDALPPKMKLMEERSLRFRGCEKTPAIGGDKGSCADVRGLVLEWGEIVAFDLWFSLLPGGETTYEGGVLLGVQSTAYADTRWPFYHQQFIVVDAQRDLYCSVISSKQRVAARLETNRWYHLALMFDCHTQRVYLDGALVSEAAGAIHHEAFSLRCMQLGTGCISAGSPGKPTPTYCGWYGFHGLVDEFRTWGMTLSGNAVARLAHGEIVEELPRFSLRYNGMGGRKGGAAQVQCSRPRERVCEIYHMAT